MTFDSLPSAAATAIAVRADEPVPPADAESGDAGMGALAALLADPSTVSSEEPEPAGLAAVSPGAEAGSEPSASSCDPPSDEPAASEAPADPASVSADRVETHGDQRATPRADAPAGTAAPPFVIALPDRTAAAADDAGGGFDDAFLRGIADTPSVSFEETGGSTAVPDSGAREGTASAIDAAADEADTPAVSPAWVEAPAPAAAILAETLLQDIADTPFVSSDRVEAPAAGPAVDNTQSGDIADAPPVLAADPGLDKAPFGGGAGSPVPPAGRADSDRDEMPLEVIPPGPAAALAFATDPDTETALRDGLLGYESASGGDGDPQVWQGGLRAAIAALADGHSAPLVFVDIDGVPYPAGAIHELAAVCEVGTVVIAVGSDDSARPGRELLLAGVSDYLAKPVSAEAVRAVAVSARDATDGRPGGCVAGFVGSGGSGATTVATATALHVAARGCYVSVLDLSRSVAAAALALGVEPAAGLDQLLETAGKAAPDPEMVEGVCARRSGRIEVFAHRWSPTLPAAPSSTAVDSLLAVLRRRSQLVVVDGFDAPAMRLSPPVEVDRQVFVAEPTAEKAARAGRMMEMFGTDRPPLFVQNHTRAFRRGAGARALRSAGIEIEPDAVIPFEPLLPRAADWGWPRAHLPRSLRKPVTALTDRLLEPSPGAGSAASGRPPWGA